jgi:hypothetical protein
MDGVVKIVLQRMLVDMTLRHRSSTCQRIGADRRDARRWVYDRDLFQLFLSETLL